jgi:stage III sporulation protein AE
MKIWVIVLLALFTGTSLAWAGDLAENVTAPDLTKQLFEKLSVDEVNQYIAKMNSEIDGDLPELSSKTALQFATQGLPVRLADLAQTVYLKLVKEFLQNLHLLGELIFLAVLCALLQNLQNSFEQSGIALLSYGVCFALMSVLVLHAFYNVMLVAKATVGTLVGFMEALLPLLLSLLTGVGAFTSAALFTPLMLFVVNVTSSLTQDVVLPLLFLTALLECVNYLSDHYRLTNLAGLLKQSAMVILGLTLVIFVGIVTIQGVAGGVADGVTLRTAKFATATFIPVVGKMFADTVEVVMGASLLLKNGIGIFGLFIIITLCTLPLIKMLSLIITIKLAGALVQPLGDEKMSQCLNAMGNNLLLVFGAILVVTLMFFLVITMIIGVGNMALTLR